MGYPMAEKEEIGEYVLDKQIHKSPEGISYVVHKKNEEGKSFFLKRLLSDF